MLVAVNNLQGYVHQLYLEKDVGLVSLADNPLVAVDVHNVVRGQVLHVNKREGGEAHEYKNVTHKGQVVVVELMGYDSLQFVFGQELPFLAVGADVVIDFVACKARTGQRGCGESSHYSALSSRHLSATCSVAR